MEQSDRRIAPRIEPHEGTILLKCRRGVSGLGSDVATTLMDISETGARLVIVQQLATGQEVEVEFETQEVLHVIRRISNVRWQRKLADGRYCIGAEFQKRLGCMEWRHILALR